jgi:Cu-Zn family superoxide dismutase
MHWVASSGDLRPAGTVLLEDSPYGLVLTPDFAGLPPGLHGFHVHERGSCAPDRSGTQVVPAGAAGGHWDPKQTKRHGAPWGDGHMGDLPALHVDLQGNATQPVLAPRLSAANVSGRALIVHAGADNHADHPAPLGGGGVRLLCGVID